MNAMVRSKEKATAWIDMLIATKRRHVAENEEERWPSQASGTADYRPDS